MKKIKKFLSTNTTIDGPRFESIVRSIRHVLLFIVFLSSLSLSILVSADFFFETEMILYILI